MGKWSFNFELFTRLPEVLGKSFYAISKKTGICVQTINNYSQEQSTISVQNLIKLCNGLRMPASLFLSEDGVDIIPGRGQATIPTAQFQPIQWSNKNVERLFGGRSEQIHYVDVAEAMDVTNQKPQKRLLLETRFPIDDFLKMCNKLHISPYTLILDNNQDYKKSIIDKYTENAKKTERIVKLEGLVGELKKNLESMQREVEELKTAYANLSRQFGASYEIHHFKDSSIAIAADAGK